MKLVQLGCQRFFDVVYAFAVAEVAYFVDGTVSDEPFRVRKCGQRSLLLRVPVVEQEVHDIFQSQFLRILSIRLHAVLPLFG